MLRAWQKGVVFRSSEVFFEKTRIFKGRRGIAKNVRAFHTYILPLDPSAVKFFKDGVTYVGYSRDNLDHRAVKGGKSKSASILEFLRDNAHRAWLSRVVCEALKDKDVRPNDAMTAVNRYAKRGLIYIRGYKSDTSLTPFREGYLLTWIDQGKPQESAMDEAFQRTEQALFHINSTNPMAQRVRRIRAYLIEAAKMNDIVSPTYLRNQLRCSDDELEGALTRAMQLYPDIREMKLFDHYRYFYHSSISPVELKATMEMKKNYVRKTKWEEARVGHNWEACVEWFIDKFTPGAHFWTQSHRTRMDPGG